MKPNAKPIRSTIIWGLISGLSFMPLTVGLSYFLFWPVDFQLTIWAFLAGYGTFLTRWTQKPLRTIFFPLLLLFLATILLKSTPAFLFLALAILSWIRSGICFTKKSPAKRFGAEIVLSLGAGLLVSGFVPGAPVTEALGVWLFFLTQALYFVFFEFRCVIKFNIEMDPFERAKIGAEKVLSSF